MATYRVMKTKLPVTLQSMSLYLANKDTEFILFKPVRVGVSSAPSAWGADVWIPLWVAGMR